MKWRWLRVMGDGVEPLTYHAVEQAWPISLTTACGSEWAPEVVEVEGQRRCARCVKRAAR